MGEGTFGTWRHIGIGDDFMENHFAFLGQARPAGLYRLLEKLPLEDAALALAGLPAGTSVQVMAYFPESRQAELVPALREARRADPGRAAQAASRIKDMLLAAKYARDGQAGPEQDDGAPAAPAKPPASAPVKSYAPPQPSRPSQSPQSQRPSPASPPSRPAPGPGGNAAREAAKPPPRPAANAKPVPWVPRTATSSPINGPALPGKPPPVAGDPLRSPLAKAGLLDLLGRAQQKLMPKNTAGRPAAPQKPAAKAGGRPEPVEGVVRSVRIDRPPRVIGPGMARTKRPADAPEAAPSSGGARRMDGKAILAAILREAGPTVRHTVQDDDPALFRALRERMFFFDDLIYTEDDALARVFTAAPADVAALALRFAAPPLRERVLRVVSPGRAQALREPPPGRAGMDAIEQAQKKVLDVALQLQAAGRILIDPRDPDLASQ